MTLDVETVAKAVEDRQALIDWLADSLHADLVRRFETAAYHPQASRRWDEAFAEFRGRKSVTRS